MSAASHERRPRIAISLEMDHALMRHQDTFAGCQAYADEAGWECFIHPAPDRVIPKAGDAPPFDGIIARATPEIAAKARAARIPLVNVWINTPVRGLPSVFPDSAAIGRMAAEHLLGRGFRSFGFLGLQRDASSTKEWQGFSGLVRSLGHPCSSHRFSRIGLEGTAPGWERFVRRLNRWIDGWKTPIGIFVTHDLYCRYLIDICRSRGLHVSQDVAIIGAGNESIICERPAPSLSSVDCGYARIGYRAAALLAELMKGAPEPPGPILVPPAELVARQSTDLFATEDPVVTRALRFIAENSHQRIEVKEVVQAIATNRRSLERKFREHFGRTVAGEITRLRLERAKRRIVETDDPLKDIATESGFRNADHFYKVFLRVEGVTPSHFRDERKAP